MTRGREKCVYLTTLHLLGLYYSMTDESEMQHGWDDTAGGKEKYREDSLSQCHFVHCVVISWCGLNRNVCATTGHKQSFLNVVSYIY